MGRRMRPPLRILMATDSPLLTTGHGRSARVLADAFHAAGHHVVCLGYGDRRGTPHGRPYRVLPAAAAPDDAAVARALDSEQYDLLFTMGEPWMFPTVGQLPQRARGGGVKWLCYFPVDGRPMPAAWADWAAAVDVTVVFSRFGRDVMAEALGPGGRPPPRMIYLGVDTAVFRPAGDKAGAKSAVGVAGRFVVGTVAQNRQRKNLPALVRAFAAFARGKDDVVLYLHTPIVGYWDFDEMTRRLGVADRTRATLGLAAGRGVDDATLATIYNAMDLFVLPTMGEGFGLPLAESQACGVPALATDFSACPELLPDPVQRLAVKDTLVMASNFEQAVVDVDDLAGKLEHFYRRRHDDLPALGRRCRAFVAERFDWSHTCRQFLELLESIGQP